MGDFPGGPVDKNSPSNAEGADSTPSGEAKIPHASRSKKQNIKQKQYCNKSNKDFKYGPHQKNLKKKKKAAWAPGSDPVTEKGHDESQIKPVAWLIILHQINFFFLKTSLLEYNCFTMVC